SQLTSSLSDIHALDEHLLSGSVFVDLGCTCRRLGRTGRWAVCRRFCTDASCTGMAPSGARPRPGIERVHGWLSQKLTKLDVGQDPGSPPGMRRRRRPPRQRRGSEWIVWDRALLRFAHAEPDGRRCRGSCREFSRLGGVEKRSTRDSGEQGIVGKRHHAASGGGRPLPRSRISSPALCSRRRAAPTPGPEHVGHRCRRLALESARRKLACRLGIVVISSSSLDATCGRAAGRDRRSGQFNFRILLGLGHAGTPDSIRCLSISLAGGIWLVQPALSDGYLAFFARCVRSWMRLSRWMPLRVVRIGKKYWHVLSTRITAASLKPRRAVLDLHHVNKCLSNTSTNDCRIGCREYTWTLMRFVVILRMPESRCIAESNDKRIQEANDRANKMLKDVPQQRWSRVQRARDEEDPEIELVQGLFSAIGSISGAWSSDDASGVSRFERKRRTMTDVFPGPGLGAAPACCQAGVVKEVAARAAAAPDAMHLDAKPYTKRLNSDMDPRHRLRPGQHVQGRAGPCFHIHPDAFLGEQGAAPRIPGGEPILAGRRVGQLLRQHSVDAFYSGTRTSAGRCHSGYSWALCRNLRHTAKDLFGAPPARVQAKSKIPSALQAENVLTSMNVTSEEPRRGAPRSLQRCREILGVGLSSNSRDRVEKAIRRNDDELRNTERTERRLYRLAWRRLCAAAATASQSQQQQQRDEQTDQPGAPPQTDGQFPLANPFHAELGGQQRPCLTETDVKQLTAAAKAADPRLTACRRRPELSPLLKPKPNFRLTADGHFNSCWMSNCFR
uniref:ANK_REP_REGION domain-containing protein n=1 Tax=Macrostomum lignano TaxID=282301 RepID=A0A1I8IY06_9PLAT